MKKLISYSLWGDSKLYCEGAKINVRLAEKFYPDWVCRFYIAEDCPVLPELEKMPCELVVKPARTGVTKTNEHIKWHMDFNNVMMIDRFEPIWQTDVERVIFRDADSRLSHKEAMAVNAWIDSGELCHAIYEKECHYTNGGIMPGMCGVVGNIGFGDFKNVVQQFITLYKQLGEAWVFVDIHFLREIVFNPLGFSVLRHGWKFKEFPPHEPLEYGDHIGQVVNEEWRNIKYETNRNIIE